MSAPDAHAVVVAQLGQRRGKTLPHLQRHRVALLGIVEGDDADAVDDLPQDRSVGVRLLLVRGVQHGGGFRLEMNGPALLCKAGPKLSLSPYARGRSFA